MVHRDWSGFMCIVYVLCACLTHSYVEQSLVTLRLKGTPHHRVSQCFFQSVMQSDLIRLYGCFRATTEWKKQWEEKKEMKEQRGMWGWIEVGRNTGGIKGKRKKFESLTEREKRQREGCQEAACFPLLHLITHPCSHSLNPHPLFPPHLLPPYYSLFLSLLFSESAKNKRFKTQVNPISPQKVNLFFKYLT